MKNKKLFSIATALTMAAMPLFAVSCSKDPYADDEKAGSATPANTYEYNIPQDYCRTYYEVFVGSFADGNGDGKGDLRGLIDNLDYLNDGDDSTTTDLGINGIWMMPINQASSYHKYDVVDYYKIDKDYGNLEDFAELVAECKERDIWLQMDLVLNHTSNQHPWFKQAQEDARAGLSVEESAAMQKYCFYKQDDENKPRAKLYTNITNSDYCYISNFSSNMPDLNLDNEDVKDEIKKIVDFWLEKGVRSFRLDAVPWAFANIDSDYTCKENLDFWTWFNDYCNTKGASVYKKDGDGISRYCYNVGEVWSGQIVIKKFFETGMSNFNYEMGGTNTATFPNAVNGRTSAVSLIDRLASVQSDILANDSGAYLSNFLSNHDNDRSAGYFAYDETRIKKAAGLYLLAPGNPYIYYGEEIGACGSGRDENKRLPFLWGDDRDTLDGPRDADYTGEQKFPSMVKQSSDPNSILTYYRNAIQLRNRFPEIGRGAMTSYAVSSDGKLKKLSDVGDGASAAVTANALNKSIAAYTLKWKDDTVLIVHNIGDSGVTIEAPDFSDWSLVGKLKAVRGKVAFSGGKVTLAKGTTAVIKKI